jgi:hypothetical protein
VCKYDTASLENAGNSLKKRFSGPVGSWQSSPEKALPVPGTARRGVFSQRRDTGQYRAMSRKSGNAGTARPPGYHGKQAGNAPLSGGRELIL